MLQLTRLSLMSSLLERDDGWRLMNIVIKTAFAFHTSTCLLGWYGNLNATSNFRGLAPGHVSSSPPRPPESGLFQALLEDIDQEPPEKSMLKGTLWDMAPFSGWQWPGSEISPSFYVVLSSSQATSVLLGSSRNVVREPRMDQSRSSRSPEV